MDHKKRFSLTPQQKQLILRIAIVLAFGVLAFTVYKCPIKLLFGIDCPGCGMTRAFKAVYDMSEAKKVSLREAAYLVAIKRVADAMKLRGWC